jgi:hypothetical protein
MSAPVLVRLGALLREQGGLMASLVGAGPGATGPRSISGSGGVGADQPAAAGDQPSGADATHAELAVPQPAAGMDQPGAAGVIHEPAGPAQLAASGPRVGAHAAEYELLMEAIYEGYLLHYGTPRIVCPTEADLGLLAGDQLYALGLARLVALGDLAAVAELADVITLTALAQGAGQGQLALAVWGAGARAVGWGSSAAHRRAKALARAREPGALQAMRAAAEADAV